MHFRIAGKEWTVFTKEVREFILRIDFLSAEGCCWDFGAARIQLGGDWVLLRRCHASLESDRSLCAAIVVCLQMFTSLVLPGLIYILERTSG